MCFSAGASFGATIVLTTIGIASIKKVQNPKHLLFASIPLLFAVQQLAEGVLWKTLPYPDEIFLQRLMTFVFLFFAQIVWPFCVPIAVLRLEENQTRRTIQKILVGIGVFTATCLAYCLITYRVDANINGYHISYLQSYPMSLKGYAATLYLLATVAPLFVSSVKRMWLLGATILISYIITTLFYEYYVLSIWCFLSSLISVFIYLIVVGLNTEKSNL
jgi:hypothetical protein